MTTARLLFWEHRNGQRPQDHIRSDIPDGDRAALADILRRGRRLMGYMGWAECRICGEHLGTADLGNYGFMWPEKAEHYILSHGVWTSECSLLLARVAKGVAR